MKARKTMGVLAWVAGAFAALWFIGWLGLQVKPAPFPHYPETSGRIETVPLPAGLPAPVERFYKITYGDTIPVIESAVLTGRATIRPFAGIVFPARYRFTHVAGQDYRHYIEACWFGIPVMKVDESYVGGKSLIEIPIIGKDSGPKVEQAANIGLWAESWQLPALFLTDDRVKWTSVDEETALLTVPFKAATQTFTVHFDPTTGMPTTTEIMRFKGSSDTAKTLWITRNEAYGEVDGHKLGTVGSAMWLPDETPWAYFTLEDVRYNVDVSEYVRRKGL